MPKKKIEKKVEKREVNKEVVEMLLGHNFKENDVEDMKEKYPDHIHTYTVRVKSEGSEQSHLLICSAFTDAYRFAVMDDVGVIKLVSFKIDTPAEVLEKYIKRVADVLAI